MVLSKKTVKFNIKTLKRKSMKAVRRNMNKFKKRFDKIKPEQRYVN